MASPYLIKSIGHLWLTYKTIKNEWIFYYRIVVNVVMRRKDDHPSATLLLCKWMDCHRFIFGKKFLCGLALFFFTCTRSFDFPEFGLGFSESCFSFGNAFLCGLALFFCTCTSSFDSPEWGLVFSASCFTIYLNHSDFTMFHKVKSFFQTLCKDGCT